MENNLYLIVAEDNVFDLCQDFSSEGGRFEIADVGEDRIFLFLC